MPEEPIKVPAWRTSRATSAVFLPKSPGTQEVLKDGNTTNCGGDNGEHCVCRHFAIFMDGIPEAKVESNGHKYTVDDDKNPEEPELPFLRAQVIR